MRKLLAMLFLGLLAGVAGATDQTTAVTIDGTLTDIDATPIAQTQTCGWGTSDVDLLNLRVSNDSAYLYVGIGSKFSVAGSNQRGLWLFIDSKNGGQNTLSTSFSGTGGISGINGTVLESGFNADYLFFFQDGNSAARPTYYLDVVDLTSQTTTYFGAFDLSANTFAAGSGPVGFDGRASNAATGGDFAATTGFELKIPLSYIGAASSGSTVRVMAVSGDGSSGWWSNQCLPPNGTASDLASHPDFTAVAGSQMYEYSTTPVELSNFSAE